MQRIFNKLMTVQAGAIVEAALDQIIYRARNHTSESVPNISKEDLEKIRGTKIERFNNIIQAMQAYKLLDGLGGEIYDELHLLRQYRNRAHVQFDDESGNTDRDDYKAFSDDVVVWSLALCIRILKYLCERFPRPKELDVFAHDVSIPRG